MNMPISTRSRARYAAAADVDMPLSVRLRNETRVEHKLVEAACGLPAAIRNLADYKRCLLNFYAIFCPLERHIATFSEWSHLGLLPHSRARVPRLQQDLLLMKVDPDLWHEAPAHALPVLSQFPFALGALYVLEGSTLGGQIIMAALKEQLHTPGVLPSDFFAGRGEETGPLWHQFRTMLDAYGQQYPEMETDVIEGARRTFKAIGCQFDENDDRHSL